MIVFFLNLLHRLAFLFAFGFMTFVAMNNAQPLAFPDNQVGSLACALLLFIPRRWVSYLLAKGPKLHSVLYYYDPTSMISDLCLDHIVNTNFLSS